MYRLRFASLTLLIGFASTPALSNGTGTRSGLGAVDPPETVELLQSAIRTRIAVSRDRRGTTIPAAHCRHAVQGCERRLAEFARYLVDSAARHDLDPWLMAAMAVRESGLNPFAEGSLGELGILQINPGRRDAKHVRFMRDEWYRRRCRKEPGACQREVVEHAASLIARTLQQCDGNLVDALGLYNTGRCGGNDRYAKRVLSERDELRRSVGLDTPNLAGGTAQKNRS
jgi:hypothetical protein